MDGSLLKENNHIVVYVEANVTVGLILNRKSATQNDEAVPSLAEFVVKLCLDVLSDVRIVRRTESLEALDDRNYCCLGHFLVHVVPLDPNFSVCCASIDLKCVAIITGDDYSFSAVISTHAECLYLCRYYLHHIA